MTNSNPSSKKSLQRALVAVREARKRLQAQEQARREPLAIVGMGCRFPGDANSPHEFWQLLKNGRQGVGAAPDGRFVEADAPGLKSEETKTPSPFQAGFIHNPSHFDPVFFGISPREASRMDPQQRLFLQVAWEAFENAGITSEMLRESETGVFLGANSNDYLQLQLTDPPDVDTYTITGGANSIIANRLSYWCDLRGPSLVIDAACASSLVAVHQACNSLRAGEIHTAVAGGINLILSPLSTLAHTNGLPMAADYRCKTFDAKADGYVRGEGCGVIILKRLSDAQADGDAIWATIRGSAVNQDGRTNGLTAPNGLSQKAVIRRALSNGDIDASAITMIEAHGTGTALGDPIEVEALSETYGRHPNTGRACALGSVKTNLGHLEAAAGIAGLIKAALALHHKTIPPHLNFSKLNPLISMDQNGFHIPLAPEPWSRDSPRAAAVSSFGAGGTNAHLVLEEAPSTGEPGIEDQNEQKQPQLLLLSAREPAALRDLARNLRDHLTAKNTNVTAAALTYTAAKRRTHHEYRTALIARDTDTLCGELNQWLSQTQAKPQKTLEDPKTIFVFPGQGSQWPGMGRELMKEEPLFRETLARCEEAMTPFVDWSLCKQLQEPDSTRSEDIDVVQPSLWALQVSLAALWQKWGVKPAWVFGQSMGEVAAATVSGALTFQDGARVICLRSQLLRKMSGKGAMAVVAQSMERLKEVMATYKAGLSVAVSNSPSSTVVSGDPMAMTQLLEQLKADNTFCKPIKVDVASHSPQMDPLLDELRERLAPVNPRPGNIPICSTVTGQVCDGSTMNNDYWARNLREPVLFSKGMETLLKLGGNLFLELSPHPLTTTIMEQNFEKYEGRAQGLASLHREEEEQQCLMETLGALYSAGQSLDLDAIFGTSGPCLRLPTYPWQNRPFWFNRKEKASPTGRVQEKSDSAGNLASNDPPTGHAPRYGESLPRPGPVTAVSPGVCGRCRSSGLRKSGSCSHRPGFFPNRHGFTHGQRSKAAIGKGHRPENSSPGGFRIPNGR